MIKNGQTVYQSGNLLYTYIHKFVTVVLYGSKGSGKTTLYNMLTNSNKSSESGEQIITELFKQNSAHGQAFEIYDTPGIGSQQDQKQHLVRIQYALTIEPIHRIFLCTKYNESLDLVIQDIKKQILPIKQYKHMITIIVTHWDLCKDELKQKQHCEFQNRIIMELNLNSNSQLIFVGQGCEVRTVSEAIYNSSCQYDPEYLNLTEDRIPIEISSEMEVAIEDIKKEFFQQGTLLFDLINDVKLIGNIYERDLIFHGLAVEAYELAREKVQSFQERYGKQMVEADIYDHLVLLQQAIYPKAQAIFNAAISFMSYSLMDQEDPRNMFKSCPNCNEVWVKDEGCMGQTQCGNIAYQNTKDNLKQSNFKRIRFFYNNNRAYYEIAEPKEIPHYHPNGGKQQNPLGCGCHFTWRDEPCLPFEQLEELCKGFSQPLYLKGKLKKAQQ